MPTVPRIDMQKKISSGSGLVVPAMPSVRATASKGVSGSEKTIEAFGALGNTIQKIGGALSDEERRELEEQRRKDKEVERIEQHRKVLDSSNQFAAGLSKIEQAFMALPDNEAVDPASHGEAEEAINSAYAEALKPFEGDQEAINAMTSMMFGAKLQALETMSRRVVQAKDNQNKLGAKNDYAVSEKNARTAARLGNISGVLSELEGTEGKLSVRFPGQDVSGQVIQDNNDKAYAAMQEAVEYHSPAAARKMLEAFKKGPYAGVLDGARILTLESAIDTKERKAEEGAGIQIAIQRQALRDMQDQAVATGVIPSNFYAVARTVGSYGKGAYALEASNAVAGAELGAVAFNRLEAVKFKPFTEQYAAAEEFKPTGSENFGMKNDVYQSVRRSIASREDAFRKDPAAYTRDMAIRIVQGDPTIPPDRKPEKVVEVSVGLQRKMGANVVRVMTLEEAGDWKDKYEKADTKGKVGLIKDLKALGQYYGNAIRELGLNYAHVWFAGKDNPDAQVRGLGAAGLKEEDQKLEPDKKATVTKQAVSDFNSKNSLGGVLAWMRTYTGSPELSVMGSDLSDAYVNMSLAYGPDKAKQLMNDGISVVYDPRIFVGWHAATIQEPAFIDALFSLRQKLSTGITPGDALKAGREAKEYVQTIRDRGVFIPQGNTFVLINPTTGMVVTSGGKRAFVTMEDIRLQAQKRYESMDEEAKRLLQRKNRPGGLVAPMPKVQK